MDKEKWAEYQKAAMQSRRSMMRSHTREEVMEQQRTLDKAAGRNNPYLGLSFSELKKDS